MHPTFLRPFGAQRQGAGHRGRHNPSRVNPPTETTISTMTLPPRSKPAPGTLVDEIIGGASNLGRQLSRPSFHTSQNLRSLPPRLSRHKPLRPAQVASPERRRQRPRAQMPTRPNHLRH
jgi:hypothetical protein